MNKYGFAEDAFAISNQVYSSAHLKPRLRACDYIAIFHIWAKIWLWLHTCVYKWVCVVYTSFTIVLAVRCNGRKLLVVTAESVNKRWVLSWLNFHISYTFLRKTVILYVTGFGKIRQNMANNFFSVSLGKALWVDFFQKKILWQKWIGSS